MRNKLTEAQRRQAVQLTEGTHFPGRSKRNMLRRAVIIISAATFIVVGVIVWQLWPGWFGKSQLNTTSVQQEAVRAESQRMIAATRTEASRAVNGAGGSVDAGVAVYDQAIAKADATERVALYVQKGYLLLNSERTNEALATAQAAIGSDNTLASSEAYYILASAYEKLGKKKEAVAAYRQVLEITKKSSAERASSAGTSYYEQKIKELEG